MINDASLKPVTGEQLCPCGKTTWVDIERIRRGLLVKTFLFWLPLKRYKCDKCKRKMLKFSK